MDHDQDVAVIGAGILGLAVAREIVLRHPQLSVTVLEKESAVAVHQSGHNSGVIHGGLYYAPGSLKARLCVLGARLMYEFCEEHNVPYERCGKLVVAASPTQLGRLEELHRRGIANGVPGLRCITAEEIPEVEPMARGAAALHAPETGIVDFRQVCEALASGLVSRGVTLSFRTEVTGFERHLGRTVVVHKGGRLRARRVVVCAGLWADRLARAAGAPADPRIVPFRGAYAYLRPTQEPVVRGLVYPVPDPELPFLGVHVTRHIGGQVSLGPTALLVAARDGYRATRLRPRDAWDSVTWPGTWRMARRYWRAGASELRMAMSRRSFVAAAARYVPSITVGDLAGDVQAGVRAQALGKDGRLIDDFVLSQFGGLHIVRNAPSPAATSSLAIARELVDRIEAASG